MKLFFAVIFCLWSGYVKAQFCMEFRPSSLENEMQNQVFQKDLFWKPGTSISVVFLNDNASLLHEFPFLKEKVEEYASIWTEYANLKFVFYSQRDHPLIKGDIRISFEKNKGSWSLVGVDSKDNYADLITGRSLKGNLGPSMNFGWYIDDREFKSTVLHEFGHALGLLHEHQNPINPIIWNRDKIFAHYRVHLGWDSNKVVSNILAPYDINSTNREYDSKSIMHYGFPWDLTMNYRENIESNYNLSEGDILLIKKLYPPENITPNVKHYFRINSIRFGGGNGHWSCLQIPDFLVNTTVDLLNFQQIQLQNIGI